MPGHIHRFLDHLKHAVGFVQYLVDRSLCTFVLKHFPSFLNKDSNLSYSAIRSVRDDGLTSSMTVVRVGGITWSLWTLVMGISALLLPEPALAPHWRNYASSYWSHKSREASHVLSRIVNDSDLRQTRWNVTTMHFTLWYEPSSSEIIFSSTSDAVLPWLFPSTLFRNC